MNKVLGKGEKTIQGAHDFFSKKQKFIRKISEVIQDIRINFKITITKKIEYLNFTKYVFYVVINTFAVSEAFCE